MYTTDIKIVFADALIQLLTTKPMQSISVRQIAEQCDLSSRSFYNYFEDKFDLMNFIYYHINESSWFQDGKPGSLIVGYSNWVVNSSKYVDVWRNMYKYVGQNDLREFVLKKTRSDLIRLFVWNGYRPLLDKSPSQAIIYLMTYGLSSLLEHSLNNPDIQGPDVQTLISCIPEPQRIALISDPGKSPAAADIRIYDPAKPIWPPKLYI